MAGIGFDPSVTKVALDTPSLTKAATSSGPAFGNALKAALEGVNQTQKSAESLAQAYQMEDPNVGVEETMIAMSKANLSFQALVQVRNRLVSAYHDIMNMQV